MLHEVYLFNPDGPDLLIGRQAPRWLPATLQSVHMVVPRKLCVYHRISCRGIPRLKLSNFARLQAQALSPFTQHGMCAIKQGTWLHLWTWDAELERIFQEKHPDKQLTNTFAHSIYSGNVSHLAWLRQSASGGVEAQLRQGSHLVHTLWFAEVPTPEIWENLLAESPELATYGWPPTLASTPTTSEYSPTRWASNLTPPAHKAPGVALAKAVPVLLTASSAVLAGWGSFYYFQKESQQAAIQTGIESQDRMMAELEPLRLAKQNAMQTLRWIDAAQQLSPPLTTHGILAELAEILAPQGLVVRELELSPATLQMTVVSTTGNAPRLTYIISSIESHPWFYDVRFVDVVGGNGFKFALRLDAKASLLTDKTERDAQ